MKRRRKLFLNFSLQLKHCKNDVIIPSNHNSVSGGPGAVVKAACLESRRSRVRAPLWHSSFKETRCFFHAHLGEPPWLRERENSNFKLCVWRAVSSHSFHHPHEFRLAQFSLHLCKGGLKPHLFYFICHGPHGSQTPINCLQLKSLTLPR